jgi:hypothetical protein
LLFFAEGRIPEMPKNDWVFWLSVTNIALGAIVLLGVLLVAYALVWELVSRSKKARNVANHDKELDVMLQYGRSVPGLGVTMADGGEPIKPLPEPPAEKKPSEA